MRLFKNTIYYIKHNDIKTYYNSFINEYSLCTIVYSNYYKKILNASFVDTSTFLFVEVVSR